MKTKLILCCILIGLLVLSSVIIIYQDNKIKEIKSKEMRLGEYPPAIDSSGNLILYLNNSKESKW